MRRLNRIAFQGMKGRKKDAAILAIVITMSFLFLSVGTLLLSSLTESQFRQRMSLYGTWKFADDCSNPFLTERIAAQPWVRDSHQVTILGQDSHCGQVSVWDGDFARMGGLNILEGRAPEAPGEIVLEKGQLSLFEEEPSVGSTVKLKLTYEGKNSSSRIPDDLPETLTVYGRKVEAAPYYQYAAIDITGEDVERGIQYLAADWDTLKKSFEQAGISAPEFPVPEDPEHMTQWEIRKILEAVRQEPVLIAMMFGYQSPLRVSPLSVVTHPKGRLGAVDWNLDSTFTMYTRRGRLSQDTMYALGGISNQKVTLIRECTVVGILETTANRWDAPGITVPNCYLSQDTYEEFSAVIESLCNGTKPEKLNGQPKDFLSEDQFIFYETDAPISVAFREIQQIAGNNLQRIPFEEMRNNLKVGFPVTGEEMRAQAADLLENQEEIRDIYLEKDPVTYTIQFDCATEDGKTIDAYFVIPGFTAVRKDGTEVSGELDYGFLYTLDNGQWKTEQVDAAEVCTYAPAGYRSQGAVSGSLEDAYAYNNQNIRINRYAFPSEKGMAAAMGGTVIAVIVILTVCAVFQIFFTQLRRRVRKLTLLRSIGATNGQILQILFYEGMYILLAGLVIGDGLGWLLARLITGHLADTVFSVDWKLFLTGQLWGIAAVAVGMLLPSIRALHAPLTGRMSGRIHHHGKVRAAARQTYGAICIRDLCSNPMKTMGTGALCIFLITMELVCLFLGGAAFATYRKTVTEPDQPDFTVRMNHAGTRRKVKPMLTFLEEVEGIDRCDFYRRGQNLFLWYESMEQSPVLGALQEVAPEFFRSSQASNAENRQPGFLTDFYCIEPDTELFKALTASLTEGQINPAAYEEGKEVMVLLPMYLPQKGGKQPRGDQMAEVLSSAGRMSFSFHPDTATSWKRDTSLSLGQSITLGTDRFLLREHNSEYMQNLLNTQVGGILRFFPQDGVWPFAGDVQSHVIVGSYQAMAKLYPDGTITYEPEQMKNIDSRTRHFMPTEYGEAFFSLYAADGATIENTLSPISQFSRDNHLIVRNYQDTKQTIYEKALSSAVLVGTMAVASTMIVWMILWNTLRSAQEQSRKKTGILQALGVTGRQFYSAQIMQAVGYWAISVLAANLVVFLIVLISGLISQPGGNIGFAAMLVLAVKQGFRNYPWGLHWSVCLLELPILILFHLRAVRIPMKYSPIDNIRS